MRLLEFSIASASTKVDRSTTELVFTDWVTNPKTRKQVEQTVRIVFSPKYGRPTALDDDVFVALLSLSYAAGFKSPTLHFTCEEICDALGWSKGGSQNRMIDTALRRWTGVRVYADNFYFDKSTGLMANRYFGILEDCERQVQERYQALRKSDGNVRSWIRWSDVMHETFNSNQIRKLDLDFYRSLENGIAKKLYRYLGKYFWQKTTQEFELSKLTHQKLGMRPVKDSYKLKDRLRLGITELEDRGFLVPDSNRYSKSGSSVWVSFQAGESESKAKPGSKKKKQPKKSPLEAELIEYGVFPKDAARFAKQHSAERVRGDIELVEYKSETGDVESKPGLLKTYLDMEEPPKRPKGFVTRAERAAKKKSLAEKIKRDDARKLREDEVRKSEAEKESEQVREYLAGLPSDEARKAFEEEALAANEFARKHYHQAIKKGHDAQVYLDSALKVLVSRKLKATEEAAQ